MKLYGLIGKSLEHSYSQEIFREKFKLRGIYNVDYLLFPLESIEELPGLLKKYPQIKGLNVTIPYKEKIVKYTNALSITASETKAINTLKIDNTGSNSKITGFNTDVNGFESSFLKYKEKYGKNALILGTGGVSKAINYVLKKLKYEILFVSRSKNAPGNCINYNELTKKIITKNKVIVNATPLGMHPDTAQFPSIPYEHITSEHFLYDTIYNPLDTIFLQKGKAAGATIKNGMEMLKKQAEKSWEIWNENDLPFAF